MDKLIESDSKDSRLAGEESAREPWNTKSQELKCAGKMGTFVFLIHYVSIVEDMAMGTHNPSAWSF